MIIFCSAQHNMHTLYIIITSRQIDRTLIPDNYISLWKSHHSLHIYQDDCPKLNQKRIGKKTQRRIFVQNYIHREKHSIQRDWAHPPTHNRFFCTKVAHLSDLPAFKIMFKEKANYKCMRKESLYNSQHQLPSKWKRERRRASVRNIYTHNSVKKSSRLQMYSIHRC